MDLVDAIDVITAYEEGAFTPIDIACRIYDEETHESINTALCDGLIDPTVAAAYHIVVDADLEDIEDAAEEVTCARGYSR